MVGPRAAHAIAGPLLAAAVLFACASPALSAAVQSRFFTTSDGVRLHYLEAGAGQDRTLVFVPGWTMPAWIFERQVQAFAATNHVIAFDPRGQGQSDAPASGYEPVRRGQDIGELIDAVGGQPVVLVAWSLGVLDSLAYVKARGDGRLAGLVLVDNSVGEDPPPAPVKRPPGARAKMPRDVFVAGMFATRPSADYLARLTRASLRTPSAAAARLGAYPVPREYWREAVYSTSRPVLYVVRPRLKGQADNLAARRPGSETALFETAGHALFVDEPDRFNALVADFLARRVWPR